MIAKEYKTPFEYCPELDESCLDELSQKILEIVDNTVNTTHVGAYHDNYTVETSIFGQVRQLFISLDKDKSKSWIKLTRRAMDYVPVVFGLPIRVFRDDPKAPKKSKIFFQNTSEQCQMTMFFMQSEDDDAASLVWRLFIQEPATMGSDLEDLEDDYRVVLVGYDQYSNEIKAMWQSQTVIRGELHVVNDDLPEASTVARQSVVSKVIEKKTNGDE